MTTDTDRAALVEKLAREAGFDVSKGGAVFEPADGFGFLNSSLARFAALVAEECAKVCAESAAKLRDRKRVPQVDEHVACVLDGKAAEIRSRFGLDASKEG